MAQMDWAQSLHTQDGQRDDGAHPAPMDAPPQVNRLLALQGSAGNQAVANMLVNRAAAQPTVVQRDQNGAASPGLAPHERGDVGLAMEVNLLLDSIAEIKIDRVSSWLRTAEAKEEPKPANPVLQLIAGLLTEALSKAFGDILRSFGPDQIMAYVKKKGWETAGNALGKIGEEAFKTAKSELGKAIEKGKTVALGAIGENVASKLVSDKKDVLGSYAELTRLQIRAATRAEQEYLNLNATTTYEPAALDAKRLSLKFLLEQVNNEPNLFQRELTIGFVKLLDESRIAKHAEKYGGDTDRAWQEDSSLSDAELRLGNLVLVASHDLTDPAKPDLSFEFTGVAAGMNNNTVAKLAGLQVKEYPMTVSFHFVLQDPFSIPGSPSVFGYFTRDPSGTVRLDTHRNPDWMDRPAQEWYARYYLGLTTRRSRADRELTDEERAKFAPLGARKLYEAVQSRRINKFESRRPA